MNFQMFKLVLEKAEKSEIKLPTSTGSWIKQETSRTNEQSNNNGRERKRHFWMEERRVGLGHLV